MKLIEKLSGAAAGQYEPKHGEPGWGDWQSRRNMYRAGFEKARELAADKAASMMDQSVRASIRERFLAIGEEEA